MCITCGCGGKAAQIEDLDQTRHHQPHAHSHEAQHHEHHTAEKPADKSVAKEQHKNNR